MPQLRSASKRPQEEPAPAAAAPLKKQKPKAGASASAGKTASEKKDTPDAAVSTTDAAADTSEAKDSKAGETEPPTTTHEESSKNAKLQDKPSKSPSSIPKVGDKIALSTFGGQVLTHSNDPTTLQALVDASKAGVVIFTYPKASTGGCTTQVKHFRDNHAQITGAGLEVYGLSNDSPTSNAKFRTNQGLQYTLLCDKGQGLIGAIGMKKAGGSSGAVRGVFVVGKDGEVKVLEAGGPRETVDVVLRFVEGEKDEGRGAA